LSNKFTYHLFQILAKVADQFKLGPVTFCKQVILFQEFNGLATDEEDVSGYYTLGSFNSNTKKDLFKSTSH